MHDFNDLQPQIQPTLGMLNQSQERISPQRRKTEKAAVNFLDGEVRLRRTERLRALDMIRAAPSPKVAARQIIRRHNLRIVGGLAQDKATRGDYQELQDKLIQRDMGIWYPQTAILRGILEEIDEGMTKERFAERSAVLLKMPQALPKTFRAQETDNGKWIVIDGAMIGMAE